MPNGFIADDVDPRLRPPDEITTFGEQGQQDPPPPGSFPSEGFPGSAGGGGGAPPDPGEAFLPPTLPAPLAEIIVRAQRPLPPAPLLSPSLFARFTLPGFFALIGGVTIAKILDDLGMAKLNRALRESEPIAKPARDTQLRTISVPAMFEIVVKGVRALQLPPLPTFISIDADPFIMISIPPVHVDAAPAPQVSAPAPVEIPAPTTRPFELPLPLRSPFQLPFSVPLPLPLTSPQPTPLPLADPLPLPIGFPHAQPFAEPFAEPFAQPQARPRTTPGTRPAPRAIPLPGLKPFPFASPQPLPKPDLASPGTCPPCPKVKKKKKETRTSCFKKLVKEGLNEDLDRSFNWTEIDCITGREL